LEYRIDGLNLAGMDKPPLVSRFVQRFLGLSPKDFLRLLRPAQHPSVLIPITIPGGMFLRWRQPWSHIRERYFQSCSFDTMLELLDYDPDSTSAYHKPIDTYVDQSATPT
jgi:hypothetical protein